MKTSTTLFVLIMVTFLARTSYAGDLQENYEVIRSGNTEYAAGFYDHALELYLKVVESGYESPELYYNVGNTYYKLNRFPDAILYYERALRLAPRDENILFNLELANARIIDKIESLPGLFYMQWWKALLNLTTPDGWSRLFIVLFIAMLAGVAIYLLLRSLMLRRIVFYFTFLLLITTAGVFMLAYVSHQNHIHRTGAIVFEPSVAVKSAPSDKSIDLFVLHEGTKVTITDQVGEWKEVRIANGNRGWVQEQVLEVI